MCRDGPSLERGREPDDGRDDPQVERRLDADPPAAFIRFAGLADVVFVGHVAIVLLDVRPSEAQSQDPERPRLIDQSCPWRSVQRDGDTGHDVRIVTRAWAARWYSPLGMRLHGGDNGCRST